MSATTLAVPSSTFDTEIRHEDREQSRARFLATSRIERDLNRRVKNKDFKKKQNEVAEKAADYRSYTRVLSKGFNQRSAQRLQMVRKSEVGADRASMTNFYD